MSRKKKTYEFTRYGVYQLKNGVLAVSVCHASPKNAGKGECRHFSWADTREEANIRRKYYATERVNGVKSNDGTAGDYLSAFQNWLIMEKGYNKADLPQPKPHENITDAWFHGNEDTFKNLLQEALDTDLLRGAKIDENTQKSAQQFLSNGINLNVVSNRSFSAEDSSADTDFWYQINNLQPKTAKNSEKTVEDDGLETSTVTALASGDSEADMDELEAHDLSNIFGKNVEISMISDDDDLLGDRWNL